jgi:DNA-binding protein HU-beta
MRAQISLLEQALAGYPHGLTPFSSFAAQEPCMTKQQLIAILSEKTGSSKVDVLRFMDALEQTIREELVNGGELTLASTGKFKVKDTAARNGRNPKTGETVLIPAKRKVVFTPIKALKDAVAG